ncbi:DNA-binding protein [Tumidithrix helvetica PCC 7403]|uniref:DNA-binding protein n=1 Tax=Tumidithrix helvetica TaxID=3457545 RepID=UPI003CB315BE
MDNDLTNSQLDRQNILNNRYALEKIEEHLGLGGTRYQDAVVFTKQQLAALFEVNDVTIERYIASHSEELRNNGYKVLKGQALKNFLNTTGGTLINEGTKITVLGIFTFRAALNIAMLLTESDRARMIRSRILDIVIEVVAERSGGHTRYINQRDCNYLPSAYQEFSYRQVFTNALDSYLDMGKAKYGIFTNKIYQLVFQENAQEYRQILNLEKKDNVRDTFYAEVLRAIASVENGLAEEMKVKSAQLGRKLQSSELDQLIEYAGNNPYLKPIIEDARTKMASRDLSFREALHQKLISYIQTVPESDFEKFLGEASRSLQEQLADPEALAVFQRLKDR